MPGVWLELRSAGSLRTSGNVLFQPSNVETSPTEIAVEEESLLKK
jgi:hypothetical protein